MPYKLAGILTYDDPEVSGGSGSGAFPNVLKIDSANLEAANNVEPENHTTAQKGFNECCREGNKTRRISITTKDVLRAAALAGCTQDAMPVRIPLTGLCGSADKVLQTVSGVGGAYVRNLNIPNPGEGDPYEASFDLVVVNENGDGAEPLEIVNA